MLATMPASAQEQRRTSLVSSVAKAVALDPFTYAPAIAKYEAMHLDWESSQIFFQHGFVERNARYTVSGRSNDVAISHGAGSQKVALDSLKMLTRSASSNFAERTLEQLLVRKYPNHKKTWLIVGRASRIARSSYLAYSSSIDHFRQWRGNQRLARQMGYQ